MAIWQYELNVIPRKGILDRYGEIPDKFFMDKEGWERFWKTFNRDFDNIKYDFEDAKTIQWWKNISFDVERVAEEMDKLVKRGKQSRIGYIWWKGDMDNDEDHDAYISFDGETKEVKGFQFRTDLRNMTKALKFMEGMLGICSQNELMLMNVEGGLFEPRMELILEDMKTSNAKKFLTNPSKFIEGAVANEKNKFQALPKKKK